MNEKIQIFAEIMAGAVEILGVGLIAITAALVIVYSVVTLIRGRKPGDIYSVMRRLLGRGILLGLEFLVAADIIHTVAVEFTLENVAVLAVIVLIRTFLSFTLDLELTGRWPWQQAVSPPPEETHSM